MTESLSKVKADDHTILNNYYKMELALTSNRSDFDVGDGWDEAIELGVTKLRKYINPALQNNWICAAMGESDFHQIV